MFEVVSALLAAVLLTAIAFPQLFSSLKKDPKKLVGSSYWGVYNGTPTDDVTPNRIQVPKPARKRHVVAGSSMYAGRR